MRRLERHPVDGALNAMYQFPLVGSRWRAAWNFLIIRVAGYLPWFPLKNALYRLIGVKVGPRTAVGLMAILDIFFPEKIRIGDNSIIGYNTTILTHEFLIDEWRCGTVEIGENVMIGANCTILPGVSIGDGAVVGAHSLVNRDVAPGSRVGGVPARALDTGGKHKA